MLACADFETTTDEQDCRVWAYSISEIGNPNNFLYGNNIDDFMKICNDKKVNHTFYFHNLKFDGEFIFYWLYRNNFELVKGRKELHNNSFCTLISDTGQFYSIEICFKKAGHKTNKVTIYDSLKILNFSVAEIAKGFNLPISKLEIDYEEKREIGHILTRQEIDYIRNDVEIVARALYIVFKQGMDKMTIGSDALQEYKNLIGKKKFEHMFPVLDEEEDKIIRQAYKGGFTYLNPKYKGTEVGDGIVLDVNSLYPSRMYECQLPYGIPIYFEGKYKPDKLYPLYMQVFTCNFELKKDKIPCIQIKNKFLSFVPTEYLTSSNGEDVTLSLTSVDLDLFFKQYNVYNVEWHGGFKFKSTDKMFKKYVTKWKDIKTQSKKDKNYAMYIIAKLMQNSLYGKLSLNPNVRSKYPVFDKTTGTIHYKYGEWEKRKAIYIPVGAFITAYARYKTITSAQEVFDRFIYADTDSLHLEGLEEPKGLDIDDYELGAWKHESTFVKAKFLRQKSYIEDEIITKDDYLKGIKDKEFIEGQKDKITEKEYQKLLQGTDFYLYHVEKGQYLKYKITCAGMPNRCYHNVTFDNFAEGASYGGKLQQTRVKGGIILKSIDFTIKKQ